MKRFLTFAAVSLLFCLPSVALAEEVDPVKSWDNHFRLYAILVTAIWVLVTVLLIYFSLRYRRKKGQGDGASIHGNIFLEIVWTLVPFIIVVLLGVQTWAVFQEYRKVPKNAYELNVQGFMWGWNVTYPDGIKTTNELRVPVGTPVKVNLTSKDVLHAFYIPEYKVQEEAIPGRTTYFWFLPTKAGEYRAYCTEFCGAGHSLMLAEVHAMDKADFQAWVAKYKEAAAALSPVEKGKKLVDGLGCLGCHTITGEKSTGPTLKGIFGSSVVLSDGRKIIANEEYIEHSISEPKRDIVKGYSPIMPPYKLSDEDLHAITEYLKTLK